MSNFKILFLQTSPASTWRDIYSSHTSFDHIDQHYGVLAEIIEYKKLQNSIYQLAFENNSVLRASLLFVHTPEGKREGRIYFESKPITVFPWWPITNHQIVPCAGTFHYDYNIVGVLIIKWNVDWRLLIVWGLKAIHAITYQPAIQTTVLVSDPPFDISKN